MHVTRRCPREEHSAKLPPDNGFCFDTNLSITIPPTNNGTIYASLDQITDHESTSTRLSNKLG